MPPTITKAVFPVAGLGTRFLPATKATPKEMMPIVDKPLIQYAVEEAYAAGITEMIFVTGRHKRAIEDHFDTAYELEHELQAAGKLALLDMVRSVKPDHVQCVFVRQPVANGLGAAVLCAERLVGDEPFAVILADDLLVGTPPVMAQMVEIHNRHGRSVIATEEVPREHTKRYGIVSGQEITPGLTSLSAIVEKPAPEAAPSTQAVVGRYILSPRIFHHLRQGKPGAGGELQLTDGISALLQEEAVYAYRYAGRRFDCGSKLGYLQATVQLGMEHAETGTEFTAYLRGVAC
ncbi:UTP--glucose-1-phosphate uridylyltransferase GalU [Thiomonas sp.]|jgi:UTP--glucose-1-phosphate uridylyltransferase|uniref:UTP--glucose-1-phosphate uridylyltransferase GalU n=1 Tax=Thiomonas sp. TaxID=2047785 RepID=UPI002620B7AE|nr:UTP--glucose-1-phosphate uridylyltransferase GalU [Thiomonas sp.]